MSVDAAACPAPAPLAHAFLALGDQPAPIAPRARRGRVAAAVAILGLAVAGPVTTAALAVTAADRHDAATLPGKTWISADDDGGGAGGG